MSVPLCAGRATRALEHHLAAAAAGARPEVDDVVGDRDRLGLVLDDEHGVALVAQLQQQLVHALDVVRVQPDRRLVEDVGDVGERGAEVADHLRALRLAARQRARRPVEREVAQPDLHERVERLLQRLQQRRHRRLVEAADPLGEVADLHRADVGDVPAVDLRGPRLLAEPGPVAFGAGGERDGRARRSARMWGCIASTSFDRNDLWIVGIRPAVRQVDPVDLDLRRLLVEQVVLLALVVLPDRLVGVEEAAAAEDPPVPAVHAVAGDRDRALVERLVSS